MFEVIVNREDFINIFVFLCDYIINATIVSNIVVTIRTLPKQLSQINFNFFFDIVTTIIFFRSTIVINKVNIITNGHAIISTTTTSGLNPANKLISIGAALHSGGEGISGAVRNIVITKSGTIASGTSAFIYDGTSTNTATTLFSTNLTSKTLSAWCKLESTSQTGGGVITIENSDGSVFDSIVYNQTGNGWGFGSESFNRSTWSGISETSTSTWVHIAASYESGNNKLYRNGQLILTNTSATYNFTSNTRIMMGRRNTGVSAVFNGNIAQGLVYNRALSAAEIYNVFVAHKGRYGY